MNDRTFLKLNTSLSTASNARTSIKDAEGNLEAAIELRLPGNLYQSRTPDKPIEMQTSKLRLSLFNLPIASIPADLDNLVIPTRKTLKTKAWISFWPYILGVNGEPFSGYVPDGFNKTAYYLEVPTLFESFDLDDIRRTGRILIKRFETIDAMLTNCFENCFENCIPWNTSEKAAYLNRLCTPRIRFTTDGFSISYNTAPMSVNTMQQKAFVFYGTFGVTPLINTSDNQREKAHANYTLKYETLPLMYQSTNTFVPSYDLSQKTFPMCIVGNIIAKNFLGFLPWSSVVYSSLGVKKLTNIESTEDNKLWVLNTQFAETTSTKNTSTCIYAGLPNPVDPPCYCGYDITHKWENLTTLLLSPVSSIVILMEGIGVSSQIFPINIAQPQGSSLTTTVPIIENYYPLSKNLNDLNDELVIIKEAFDNTAVMKIPPNALGERVMKFRAAYVLKDGTMYPVYIPPHGVFSIQLTFKF